MTNVLAPIYETVRRVKAALPRADDFHRLLRCALDGRDLHGGRTRHARSGAGEKSRRARAAGLPASDRLPGRGCRPTISPASWKPASRWCRFSILGPVRCRAEDFERWCVQPTKRLVAKLRRKAARRQGDRLSARGRPQYSALCRGNRRRCGQPRQRDRPRFRARRKSSARAGAGQCRSARFCLQGGAALDREVDDVLAGFGGGPLIFNLGHGILPQTPIAHVEQMLKRVRVNSVQRSRHVMPRIAGHPVRRSAAIFASRDYWIARLRG